MKLLHNFTGLKQLDTSGRLIQIEIPGDHMQIDETWFNTFLIPKYLNNQVSH
jgi:hypothetical protein